MPPLITREEALELGALEDHAAIEALVERAWQARQERFGDSTDMCSLVNAKSGGCAEDCGFCAQSRFAEAETPMHAMMEPEQMLEHARAAEAAGAHRFCMVTQGQGLSKRDFEKVLEGARLVAEHTNLKRCASIGHMSPARAKALRDAGIQRVHHNVETAESYYDEVSTTVRYEARLRTIDAVREAGLETCVGGILNLGESREQRVEMAFQLAKIDPTSVPINLLNPRPGTKFGDREFMDPWEAVKWIAIFRLILPERPVPPVRRPRREPRRAAAAGRQGRAQRRDDGQLPDDARLHARARTARCSTSSASTSRASPTTAPTRGRTTARAGSTATRPTARAPRDRRRSSSTSACGIRRRSCASSASPRCPPDPDGAPNAWPSQAA